MSEIETVEPTSPDTIEENQVFEVIEENQVFEVVESGARL